MHAFLLLVSPEIPFVDTTAVLTVNDVLSPRTIVQRHYGGGVVAAAEADGAGANRFGRLSKRPRGVISWAAAREMKRMKMSGKT